jgi:ABC-2 type transport system ATP-binding protein
VGIVEVRRLIKELAAHGKTIVIASHILDEMEKLCTDLIIMHQGQVKYSGTLKSLMQSKPHVIIHSDNAPKIVEILGADIETLVQEEGDILEFVSPKTSGEINRLLAEKGIYCEQIYSKNQTLEKEFLDILKDGTTV